MQHHVHIFVLTHSLYKGRLYVHVQWPRSVPPPWCMSLGADSLIIAFHTCCTVSGLIVQSFHWILCEHSSKTGLYFKWSVCWCFHLYLSVMFVKISLNYIARKLQIGLFINSICYIKRNMMLRQKYVLINAWLSLINYLISTSDEA